MSAGERRERIRIVRKTRTKRTDGGYDVSPTTVAERWAKITPVRATEGEEAGRNRGAVSYLLEFDATGTDVTTGDKLVWLTNGNIELNVREVRTPMTRALALEVVAESGVVTSG